MTQYLNLAIVYLIWGSTFVAMRAAVMDHSGFQPFMVGATRLAVASAVLFAWAWLRGMDLKIKRRDLWVCAVSGVLIWLGGNAFVMWAEQWVDSGYATLVFSTLPIWTTLMGCLIDRRAPSVGFMGGALIAFGGMTLLSGTEQLTREADILVPTLVILLSTWLWAGSTHLQKRKPISCSPFIGSAYQQLFGAAGVLVAALISGESIPHPTARAWYAWGYLVVFGSIIAYSSYVQVVRQFPPSISMTFAYVSPVLTVIFGHLILGEPVDTHRIAGMIIILSSVLWIFYDQRKHLGKS